MGPTSCGNSSPTFRDNLSVESLRVGPIFDSLPLKMGPTGCPEMSVMNYHYSPRNRQEECSYPCNNISTSAHVYAKRDVTEVERILDKTIKRQNQQRKDQTKRPKTKKSAD